jgi:hypothetical protein
MLTASEGITSSPEEHMNPKKFLTVTKNQLLYKYRSTIAACQVIENRSTAGQVRCRARRTFGTDSGLSLITRRSEVRTVTRAAGPLPATVSETTRNGCFGFKHAFCPRLIWTEGNYLKIENLFSFRDRPSISIQQSVYNLLKPIGQTTKSYQF